MKPALDALYDTFNAPEAALDPIQIVRRYADVADREIVAFVAAGLAFGRVASVMASIEAVCAVLGPSPSAFVRAFDPARDGTRLKPFVHRWVRGRDVVHLLATLRDMMRDHGSIERCFAAGYDASDEDLAPAIEAFSARAGKSYFFAKPSSGSACKRMNLFLRWMVRSDAVDPGGWTRIPASKLLVPLDTHTIREVPAAHTPRVAGLEDGRGHHRGAAQAGPVGSRALRLLAVPPRNDGQLRLRHEAGQRPLSPEAALPTKGKPKSRELTPN